MSRHLDGRRIAALTRWFARRQRDLPWRRRRSGYTALVSEAMLQQTQVDRVVDRYREFLRRFPTVRRLAEADAQDVLAAWQGLGYYRRARHLQAAARMIVERFGGRVPRDAETLATLPGVGRYTAGAIASMVYGEAVPAVDGNVERVIARWDAFAGDHAANTKRTWRRAATLAEQAPEPGVLNEALMELGAMVCTPRQQPRCEDCPVRTCCDAHARGLETAIPAPKPAARQTAVHHHVVIFVRGGRMLLERRPADGLWAQMWQPPTVEGEKRLTLAAVRSVLDDRGIASSTLAKHGTFPYQTTHRRITFHVYGGTTRVRSGRWQPLASLDELPMSNAHRRVVEIGTGFRPD